MIALKLARAAVCTYLVLCGCRADSGDDLGPMEAVVGRRAAALQADALRQEQEHRAQARNAAKSAFKAVLQASAGVLVFMLLQMLSAVSHSAVAGSERFPVDCVRRPANFHLYCICFH